MATFTFNKIAKGYSEEELNHMVDWIWMGDVSKSKDYYIGTFKGYNTMPFEVSAKNLSDVNRCLEGFLRRNNLTLAELEVAEVRKNGRLVKRFN